MEMILREIENALSAKLYYLALVLSLTLPDLCAALCSPNGDSDARKYKNWYDGNLGKKYPQLSADDIWSLRNGVVHQGRGTHPKMQYSRIVFTMPNTPLRVRSGQMMVSGNPAIAFNLDLGFFCTEMIECVRTWIAANKGDPNVIANLPFLLQLRPQGLTPYVTGQAIIA